MTTGALHEAVEKHSAFPASLFGYDILDVLGHGAGSVIYLAVEPQTQQVRALKHLLRSTDCQTKLIDQMKTEFEVSRQFTHPGLRRSLELKLERTLLRKVVDAVLVMEMFDGQTLEHAAPLPLPRLLDCFIQAAEALSAMHAMGYVHCDLKPNNLLVDELGQVKIIDFGQSCKLGAIKQRIQGTADFIAPEQVQKRAISPRTDVFCLGATLYCLLTGQKVPTFYTAARKRNSFVLDQSIAPPKAINPEVPTLLSNFVMECIRTSADKRPADMKDFVYHLDLAQHKLRQTTGAA